MELSIKFNKNKNHIYYKEANLKLKIVNKKINESSTIFNLASIQDKYLCEAATRDGKWETSNYFIQYVQEAKRRGLDCELDYINNNDITIPF